MKFMFYTNIPYSIDYYLRIICSNPQASSGIDVSFIKRESLEKIRIMFVGMFSTSVSQLMNTV